MATSQPMASRRCCCHHRAAATTSARAASTQVSPRWVRVANTCSTAVSAWARKPAAMVSSSTPQGPWVRPLSASSAIVAPASTSTQADAAMATSIRVGACAGKKRFSGGPAWWRRARRPASAAAPSSAKASMPTSHQPTGCCASRVPSSDAVEAVDGAAGMVVVMARGGPFSFGFQRLADAVACTTHGKKPQVVPKFPASRDVVGVLRARCRHVSAQADTAMALRPAAGTAPGCDHGRPCGSCSFVVWGCSCLLQSFA